MLSHLLAQPRTFAGSLPIDPGYSPLVSIDELLKATRDEGPRARRKLYRRVRVELLLFFRSSVSRSDAEDLAQASLEIIAKKVPEFELRGPRAFRSFVFTVAYNRLRTHRRKLAQYRREQGSVDDYGVDPQVWPAMDEVMIDEEERSMLAAAMDALRSTFRRVLVRRLAEDSYESIALDEGVKPESLRPRLRRARLALGREIDKRVRPRVRPRATPSPS